jgi:hypothetical protein
MPLHTHPVLRSREDCMVNAGLIQALDSAGFLALKDQENRGATFKQVPKVTYIFNGVNFTATPIPTGT